MAQTLKRVATFVGVGLAVAIAGCSQAPPTPTTAPAAPTTAPPAAKPTTAPTSAPAIAASPAVSPVAAPSPSAAVSPVAAASPAVKPAASVVASPSAVAAAASPTPFSVDTLSAIQPGLGTVMIEYGRRMASVWFAGEASNWDMAKYQIIEMREIQEVGETTRPARATALKSFESSFLDPLDEAVAAGDKAKFESAYRSAIQGCNSCHGSQTSADFPKGFGFIKVQVPQKNLDDIYVWAP